MRVKYAFSSRKTRKIDPHNKHKQQTPALAKEVIKVSDIVLEVLDARFIEETRNKELESFTKAQGKMLIYVINKADLVDVKTLMASGQLEELKPYVLLSCKKFVGRKRLRDTIKIAASKFKKKPEEKKEEGEYVPDPSRLQRYRHAIGNTSFFKIDVEKVHVGIIGYPNTGKSSLINMAAARNVAGVSAQAGFTKGIQKIRFSDNIIILDTPGVIIDDKRTGTNRKSLARYTKIGVKTYDKTKNPDFDVMEIMREYPNLLEKHYGINANGDVEVLLEELGRKWNFLRKGNVVDVDRTARMILKDWQSGKIRAT